ncbi:MAG TPA: hypothetical protein VM914_09800 [Pyrinomonadaceae bacterium]|jgi:hypothetical protein|nr:hypothetical protein [Pyrinomonadaceae bacterium]
MASHRILYAGVNTGLLASLRDGLDGLDCFLVYSPVSIARTFIQSGIEYSLLLFDETEAGKGLEAYARALPHRERVPVIFVKESEGFGLLLEGIKRRLTARGRPGV